MSNSSDLLAFLLSAVDDEGQPFTNQEIKEQALSFVGGGGETTGSLMVWLFHIWITHKHALQACREEINRILSDCSVPYFLRHCIHEHTIGTEH
ncbi:unnamed protein product [Rotaria sp. Silwood1]|nr:unnamed protein product [Rotaria sp. Silwood1]CAF3550538.1 unnamed protein product [Rotaria sp. Silwood1]CAF4915800.1 unnamed protein product [Rotaria sp. Silwood1]